MAQAVGPYTIAMPEAFSADGKRYEILDAALIVTPAPSLPHQTIQACLGALLYQYVQTHRLGRVWYGPADVVFDEHTVLEPDLLVVLAEGARQFRSRAFSPLLATL